VTESVSSTAENTSTVMAPAARKAGAAPVLLAPRRSMAIIASSAAMESFTIGCAATREGKRWVAGGRPCISKHRQCRAAFNHEATAEHGCGISARSGGVRGVRHRTQPTIGLDHAEEHLLWHALAGDFGLESAWRSRESFDQHRVGIEHTHERALPRCGRRSEGEKKDDATESVRHMTLNQEWD